jgi:hypothetical protein
MRVDVTGLAEDDVLAMDQATVLDLDMDGLYYDLPERMNALSSDGFLAVYTSCLGDLRDHDIDQYDGERLDLINRTIALASDTTDAAAVLADWFRFTGFVEEPDEDTDDADTAELDGVERACVALAYQLARNESPPTAAEALTHAAEQAIDAVEAGVNIRWLLRFNIRAARALEQRTSY